MNEGQSVTIYGSACIHQDRYSPEPCGRPVRADGPHGWLCHRHDAQVNRPARVPQEKSA